LILVFENILGALCIISYGQLCVYYRAIESQDIQCGVYYHLAIGMLLAQQASGF
jgi:hypothetical protein